ncbi:MAG: hypothetical protein E7621_05765 [Ruminococcaceae bacterium]|nr:hypothetical protein [Oscillospiraceae bacterium]
MGLFGKRKKDTKNENTEAVINDNEITAYKDGVFEVFENKCDGKKYGRILKYHGSEKVFEMSEEEFSLWKDASDNFGKYRITYERDEEYFIEKATIELASNGENKASDNEVSDKNLSAPTQYLLSDEEKQEQKELVEFYNSAVTSPDFGASLFENATLAQCLCAASCCDRKVSEIISETKKNSVPGKKLEVQLPQALAKTAENAKKALFERVNKLDNIYVLYSENTKRQHFSAGTALVAVTKEAGEILLADFISRNQKVFLREVKNQDISKEFANISMNGLRGIRFIYKYGMAANMQVNIAELEKNMPFPENIRLRGCMTAFFQDLKNGVPIEKLKAAELSMYDAMFRSTLLQPCAKKPSEGEQAITVSIVKDSGGNAFMDLYTSQSLMEGSQTYKKFITDNPENYGYKKWSFDNIIAELSKEGTLLSGFMIDKECIPSPFGGKNIERIINLKKIWDDNGKTFASKTN